MTISTKAPFHPGDKVRCREKRHDKEEVGVEYTVHDCYLRSTGWYIKLEELLVSLPHHSFAAGRYTSRWAPVAELGTAPVTKPSNPKEAIGDTKLNLSVVPDSLPAYAATAFTEGALKYGSYNWRAAGVRASTYIAACRRHMAKWWNGEQCDPKTQVHHLASSIACLAIILDAELVGKLNDDRPPKANMTALIESLEGTVAHLKDMSKGINPHHYTAQDADQS